MIAVIVPVLGRPLRIEPLAASIRQATPEPHRLLFVASEDDVDEIAALEVNHVGFITVPAERGSWACKINDGYRATTEEWVFTGADDLDFHPGWFTRALRWADERTGVIGTNDIANPRVMTGEHSTHSLFRRAYIDEYGTIDQPGQVMHEGYGHDYADDEAVATARARGAYVHAFDSIVEHLHPMVGKAADDDTYRKGRAQSRTGKQLFLRRRRLWTNPVLVAPAVKRAVVVTACYGGVDTVLHPQTAQDVPTEWVCFTDEPGLTVPPPWRVEVRPSRFADPVMAAKEHKTTPIVGCTDVVWIDASTEVTSRTFVREALAARHDGVACFRHPRRDCIESEAVASLGAEGQGGKYASQPLMEQVAAYRAEGHPEHGGLYACGVVAWDLANPKAVELGRQWLAECERWSWQDQLSFPVVARRIGATPGVFPVRQIEPQRNRRGPYLENRWQKIWPHTVAAPPAVAAPLAGVSVCIPFTSGCEHRAAARRYVLAWYAKHFPDWELVEGRCEGEWSKGRALADAVGNASHDVLVVADADSVTTPMVLNEAAGLVAGGAPWVVPHRTVYRLSQSHTGRVYEGAEPAARDTCRSPYAGVVGGGFIVVSRDAWRTVGGIDLRFVGWGGEDIAVGWALETLCGPATRLNGPLFHLWHPQEQKGRHRRGSPESELLAGRYREARNNPDAMRGLVAEAAVVQCREGALT